MKVDRVFSTAGVHPFDQITWEFRTAEIKDEKGRVVFRQENVEVPSFFSQLATNIVASKYFYGDKDKGDDPRNGGREHSVKQLVSRVADTITDWGIKGVNGVSYFDSPEDGEIFRDELTWLLVNQYGAFNSPVWFNLGLWHKYLAGGSGGAWHWDEAKGEATETENSYQFPQISACFIISVEDTMASIMERARAEASLFKFGSGAGSDNSRIRSSKEKLSGGGKPSGPLSFMKIYDSVASVVKSGGVTRRAAKMEILRCDHPDIFDFVDIKLKEEAKAHALIREGYESNFNGEAYSTVCFQNSNLSVRATDAFLKAVENRENYSTVAVTTGKVVDTFPAIELMDRISLGTWKSGDPGLQYDDTIEKWNTTSVTDLCRATNPCCTPGDTLIAVADGRNAVPIKDLVGTVVDVYTWDHNRNKVTIAPMYNIGVKRKNAQLYRVTLDDGSYFRATDDHLIMLRDGSYRQVKDLVDGDSLMPFHSQVQLREKTRTRRRHVYTGAAWSVQYRWLWIHNNGKPPVGYHIHHRDFNSLNDRLDNFQLMTKEDHVALHREMMLGDNNPARRCMNDEWRENLSKATRGERNPNWGKKHSPEVREKMRNAAAIRWSNPDQHETASLAKKEWVAKAKAEGRRLGREPLPRETRCCPVCRQNFGTIRENQVFCSNDCRNTPLGLEMTGRKSGDTQKGRTVPQEIREKISATHKAIAVPEDKRRAQSASLRNRCLKAARILLDGGYEFDRENWADLKSVARSLGAAHVPSVESVSQFFESFDEFKEHALLYNHKVVSVEPDGIEDVYDGTVDIHHNFGIITSQTAGDGGEENPDYSGCFIHNSEFVYIDDTSCNLASINLMKFRKPGGGFDDRRFRSACRIFITAQEILVDNASYPTKKIAENSHKFRPLGLGYANLGSLLMANGVAYDSEAGRYLAGAITAIMHGEANLVSVEIAKKVGPYDGFSANREPMTRVMGMHRDACVAALDACCDGNGDGETIRLWDVADSMWNRIISGLPDAGIRNGQVSVLAPTGCVVPNTLVLTDKGLRRIRSLGDQTGAKWQDADFKVQTDDGPKQATKFFVNGMDHVIRLDTERGYQFRATPKHRIKAIDEHGNWVWRSMKDLQPGDYVPMQLGGMIGDPVDVPLPQIDRLDPRATPFTIPKVMTRDFAELIGAFMANGSLHKKGLRVSVFRQDKVLIDRTVAMFKDVFGLEATVEEDSDGDDVVAVYANSMPLARWWADNGFAKIKPHENHAKKGYKAHVPDQILHTNDPLIYAAFLRGFIDHDGTVSDGCPEFQNTSREAIDDIKVMALALGIPTHLRYTICGKSGNKLWRARVINNEYNAIFDEIIGFTENRKANALSTPARTAGKKDYIPIPRELLSKVCVSGHADYSATLLSHGRFKGIPRKTAIRLYRETGNTDLGRRLGFFYDRVKETRLEDEPTMTLDLSVPENVTYTAGGFISHNTIAFLMDCDTTGVEPDIALVKYKSLAGGGMLKIVNRTIPMALKTLGYNDTSIRRIVDHVEKYDTIEDVGDAKSGLDPDHLPIFDCAFKAANGERSIHWRGHVLMMAAIQPFLSGAISKTVNMPNDATVEDIREAYLEGWRLGLKALAIYRDGSKMSQPLNTKSLEDKDEKPAKVVEKVVEKIVQRPTRERLPETRQSITHKFDIQGHEGYVTVGLYPDGRPGEIFVKMAKEGSTIGGFMDVFGTSVSIGLQYGVPLSDLIDKFEHTKFEPSGYTKNEEIRIASSVPDYIFRWLKQEFPNGSWRGMSPFDLLMVQSSPVEQISKAFQVPIEVLKPEQSKKVDKDANTACPICGGLMVPTGRCHTCPNCAYAGGCG